MVFDPHVEVPGSSAIRFYDQLGRNERLEAPELVSDTDDRRHVAATRKTVFEGIAPAFGRFVGVG
jgi:hypothetical protein